MLSHWQKHSIFGRYFLFALGNCNWYTSNTFCIHEFFNWNLLRLKTNIPMTMISCKKAKNEYHVWFIIYITLGESIIIMLSMRKTILDSITCSIDVYFVFGYNKTFKISTKGRISWNETTHSCNAFGVFFGFKTNTWNKKLFCYRLFAFLICYICKPDKCHLFFRSSVISLLRFCLHTFRYTKLFIDYIITTLFG